MALSEEQRKRIEENRKRALEIRKEREREKEEAAKGFVTNVTSKEELLQEKRRRVGGVYEGGEEGKKAVSKTLRKEDLEDSDGVSLEDFERDASAYISQTEAQRVYCLPKGTIDVLPFIERDNPHQRGWSKMKLYSRAEVRRRARKRFGGREGLAMEREKRKQKRYEKELREVKKMT